MSILDYVKVNALIDVKSDNNIWKAYRIVQVYQTEIEIRDISHIFGTIRVPVLSKKLAPFRSYSSFQNDRLDQPKPAEFSLEEFQTKLEAVEKKRKKQLLDNSPSEIIQFFRGDLAYSVEYLVDCDYLNSADDKLKTIKYLEKVLDLVVSFFKEFFKLFEEYENVLKSPSKFLANSRHALASCLSDFFDLLEKTLGMRGSKFFTSADDHRHLNGFGSVINEEECSYYFLHLLDYFVGIGGFSAMSQVVRYKDGGVLVPVQFLNGICLYRFEAVMQKEVYKNIKEDLAEGLAERLSNLSEKDFKYLDIENLQKIINGLNFDKEFALRTYAQIVKCPYLEKRIKSLNELNSFLQENQSDQFSLVLDSEKLLADILETRPHEELLKRSVVFFRFMSEQKLIQKKECEFLIRFALSGSKKEFEASFKIFKEIGEFITEENQVLVYQELTSISHEEVNLIGITEFLIRTSNAELLGLFECYLVDHMQDESVFDRTKECIKCLVKLYTRSKDTQFLSNFIETFPLKLQSLSSVPQYIKIALEVFNDFDIEELTTYCTAQKIKRLLVNNLILYMTSDRSVLKFSHKDQIAFRFKLLEFICVQTSHSIYLRTSEISKLWDCFLTSSKQDAQLFLTHLSVGSSKGPLVQDFSKVFKKFFLNENKFIPRGLSNQEYFAFKQFFLKTNSDKSVVVVNGVLSCTKSADILGIDQMIESYLTSQEESSKEIKNDLFKLFRFYSLDAREDSVGIFNKNLKKFIKKIDISDRVCVEKALIFFIFLLDLRLKEEDTQKCYILTGKESKKIRLPALSHVRHIRKEISFLLNIPINEISFKIKAQVYSYLDDFAKIKLKKEKNFYLVKDESDVFELDTSEILSNNSYLRNLVFNKLMKTEDLQEITWDFVRYLPVNQEFKIGFYELQDSLEFPEDPHDFLHCLLLYKKFSKDQDWLASFLRSNIPAKILDFIKGHKNFSIQLIPVQEELLLEILAALSIPKELSEFILFYSLEVFSELLNNLENTEYPSEVLENCKVLLQGLKSSNLLVYKVSLFIQFPMFFKNILPVLLAFKLSTSIFRSLESLLFELIKDSDQVSTVFSILTCESTLSLVLQSKTSKFFTLFLKGLIKAQPVPQDLLKPFNDSLLSHAGLLFEHTEYNEHLDNFLKLLKTSEKFLKKPSDLTPDHFLSVFQAFLSGPDSDSKCKFRSTRCSFYSFVTSALLNRPALVPAIELLIESLLQNRSWRSSKNWSVPFSFREKTQKFVGLKNLANTCYMNSLFQQLFFVKPLMSQILNTQSAEATTLFQVQKLFTKLLSSNAPFTSARSFCSSFLDFEGKKLDIRQQMDVDEFFCLLLDKFEEELKGSKKRLIHDLFGLSTCIEMISECSHRSEREEMMISLPLEVKEKQQLSESLASLVQGEIMEGQNSYFCESCQRKVKSLRRTSFKSLPNYFVFTLRRFEFNYDLMQRNKIDEFFEFPNEVNFKEFTTEFLNNRKMACDQYYCFRLKGVIVHYGKAEHGHYYSFVKDSQAWFEFNDSSVSVVSEQYMKNKAFGRRTGNDVTPCAYLLVYERESLFQFKEKEKVLELEENLKVNKEYVNRKNYETWVKKMLLGYDFLYFAMKSVKKNLISCSIIAKYCLNVLLRIDKCYQEKFEVLKYLLDNFNKEVAVIVCESCCCSSGVIEFLLTCNVLIARKIVAKLIQTAISFLDKEKIERFFLGFLSIFNTLQQFSFTAEYFEVVLAFGAELPEKIRDLKLVDEAVKYLLDQDTKLNVQKPASGHSYKFSVFSDSDQVTYNKSSALVFIQKFPHFCSKTSLAFLQTPECVSQILQKITHKEGHRAFSRLYQSIADTPESSAAFISFFLFKIHEKSVDVKKTNLFIITQFLYKHPMKLEVLLIILTPILELMPVNSAEEFSYYVEFLLKIISNGNTDFFDVLDAEKISLFKEVILKFIEEGYADMANLLNKLEKYPNFEKDDIDLDLQISSDQAKPGSSLFVFDSKRKKFFEAKVEKILEKEFVLVEISSQGKPEKMLKSIYSEEVQLRISNV